jgi:hypothetical protein
MHCIDGDECLIAHEKEYAGAVLRMECEHLKDRTADVSVWVTPAPTGFHGMVAWYDRHGTLRTEPKWRYVMHHLEVQS